MPSLPRKGASKRTSSNPGRERPQPSQAGNDGIRAKEERGLPRVVSALVARPRGPPSSRSGGPAPARSPKKILSICRFLRTKRPRSPPPSSTIARHPTESAVSFARLVGGWRGEAGPPDEPPNPHGPRKAAGPNRPLIHPGSDMGTLTCCGGVACSSCVAECVLVARFVIFAARWESWKDAPPLSARVPALPRSLPSHQRDQRRHLGQHCGVPPQISNYALGKIERIGVLRQLRDHVWVKLYVSTIGAARLNAPCFMECAAASQGARARPTWAAVRFVSFPFS
ncbi:hypothetical protein TcCL_ESM00357 [Trypanosoma cruzi]|nr:hypothetical protein TcCL_ESM00357 [Trypanosoma cruzi]